MKIKRQIGCIHKIIELLLFLLLIYIIIITNSTKNISGFNSFIVSLRGLIVILIFLNYGVVCRIDKENKKIDWKNKLLYLFLTYLVIYIVYLFTSNNSLSLLPIEILNLQPFFVSAQQNSLFNSIWIVNYFIVIQLIMLGIVNCSSILKKWYNEYKKYLVIAIGLLVFYLSITKNLHGNIFYDVLLWFTGYSLCDIFYSSFMTSNDNNIINYLFKLILPLYASCYLIIMNGGQIIKLINKIGHARTLLIFLLLIVSAIIINVIINIILLLIKKLNISFKYYLFGIIFIIFIHIIASNIIYLKNNPKIVEPTIEITNGNVVLDLNSDYLYGKVFGNRIDVYINENHVDTIIPSLNSFKYKINTNILDEGWNYIEFIVYDATSQRSAKAGGAINNIMDQPDTFIPDENVKIARKNNKKLRRKYYLYDDYEYYKDYFLPNRLKEGDNISFDKNGIPMAKWDNEFYYNPVTISGEAFAIYSEYLKNKSDKNKNLFLKFANWYVENNDNGILWYPINFAVGSIKIYPKWSSGMAQGRALSVLSRAYYLTNDKKYLETGKKVLNYMVSSADKDIYAGTSKKLFDFTNKYKELQQYNDYILFEEYVTNPSPYVLNGDLFALLGLYDWSKAVPKEYGSDIAKESFDKGIKSIEILLPYYDYYGWSSYALNQYTNDVNGDVPVLGNSYAHRCHLQLLYIFYTKTNSEKIKKYVDIFESYYKDDFWIQSDIIYKHK